MEEVKDVKRLRFIAFSDIISLAFFCFALWAAGIDPRRHVWGRTLRRRFLIALALAMNVIFSLFRFIYEGVHIDTGPREFLLVSVIYCSRWIWLYFDVSRPRARKAFEVARHLKNLKTIRLRTSTRGPNSELETESTGLSEGLRALALRMMNWGRPSEPTAEAPIEQGSAENGDGRNDQPELVIRSGARNLPQHGAPYWRGVEDIVETYESNGDILHFVRLVERELHSNVLDIIGTYEYKRGLDVEGVDGLYKKIYDLVMTCDVQGPNLEVNYELFLDTYSAISATTNLAVRTGSISETPLGNVARRIAADACYYVTHDKAQLRTELHVKRLNKCIEEAAEACLSTYTRRCNPVLASGGENTVPNNRDSNV